MKLLFDSYKRFTRQITPAEMAAAELAEAELRLLEAESAVEYAQSIVVYNQSRIRRLKKLLNEMSHLQHSGNGNH